jgi:hypothetical protein
VLNVAPLGKQTAERAEYPRSGRFVDPAAGMAAPNPPRGPYRTTRAFGSESICRRSAESVLVSFADIGYTEPSITVI